MIKAVLFDLDGTLLPMDMEVFTGGYFKFLTNKAVPFGYTPEEMMKVIWAGTKAMQLNDGSATNEEVFWNCFAKYYGEEKRKDRYIFDEFYENEFAQAKQFCGFDPMAAEAVRLCRENGFRIALATNPIFPATATRQRIRWAGLDPEDFEFYTAYEKERYSKPNPKYFLSVADRMGLMPEECLMVGNDTAEDIISEETGMKVFLITANMINKKDCDINRWPHGAFADLMDYIKDISKGRDV